MPDVEVNIMIVFQNFSRFVNRKNRSKNYDTHYNLDLIKVQTICQIHKTRIHLQSYVDAAVASHFR